VKLVAEGVFVVLGLLDKCKQTRGMKQGVVRQAGDDLYYRIGCRVQMNNLI
jgi:hypothetical protein